ELADELSSELSGNFKAVVLGLLMLPPVYDAYELKSAMKVRICHLVSFCEGSRKQIMLCNLFINVCKAFDNK
ncbi:hypothetical protein XENOCAPTIV_012970, partial [Xenoophorus captivus]